MFNVLHLNKQIVISLYYCNIYILRILKFNNGPLFQNVRESKYVIK